MFLHIIPLVFITAHRLQNEGPIKLLCEKALLYSPESFMYLKETRGLEHKEPPVSVDIYWILGIEIGWVNVCCVLTQFW